MFESGLPIGHRELERKLDRKLERELDRVESELDLEREFASGLGWVRI